MTPTAADILLGNARVIAGLAGDENGLAFTAAKLGVVAMLGALAIILDRLLGLAAQEAEAGVAVRVAENAAIAALLGDAAAGENLTISALDAVNAALRRRLIAYHERVEGDPARDAEVLALYRRMAEARLLTLPAM